MSNEMVERRCDRCKHWVEPGEWEANEAGFRRCGAVREGWEIQDEVSRDMNVEWDDDPGSAWVERRREALQKSGAYVMDGSQYKAMLFTGPDFYCALFEPAILNDKS